MRIPKRNKAEVKPRLSCKIEYLPKIDCPKKSIASELFTDDFGCDRDPRFWRCAAAPAGPARQHAYLGDGGDLRGAMVHVAHRRPAVRWVAPALTSLRGARPSRPRRLRRRIPECRSGVASGRPLET